jgi:formate C-acetyltransferase
MDPARLEQLKRYRAAAEATMARSSGASYTGESTGRIYQDPSAAESIQEELARRAPGAAGAERFVEGFRLMLERSPVEARPGEVFVGDYYFMLPYEIVPMLPGYGRKGLQIMQSCGHTVGNVAGAMRLGWDGIREGIREARAAHAKDAKKADYLDRLAEVAALIVARIEAYGDEAAKAAGECADPAWADDLREASRVCAKIAHEPPATLREALQWHWLYVTFERATSSGMGACRLDETFRPWYEADRAAGRIDYEGAVDLLTAYFLKEILFHSLGGVREDGTDAVSDLSFAALDAYDAVGGPGNLNVRWHPGLDERFLRRAVGILAKHRGGVPGFVNDAVIVPSLTRFGFPLAEARSYCFAGCFWYVVPGKEYPYHDMESLSGPRVLKLALAEALERGAMDFDELMDIFRAKTDEAMAAAVDALGGIDARAPEAYPEMVLTLVTDGAVAKGLDVTDNGAERSMTTVLYVGLATTSDSLLAIRKAVYERRDCTLSELAAALEADFEGREPLRLLLASMPKFGNGDPEADGLAALVARDFKEACARRRNTKGFAFRPAFYSWHRHIFEGKSVGATPDGRRAGLPVSQGANPSHGQAAAGVTAAIGSIAGIGFDDTAGGPAHLHFAGRTDADALLAVIRTAFAKGLAHVIVNHVDKAALRDAMRDPEAHRDLLIRVTGYSARFTGLAREVQEEVLLRTVW